MFLITFRMLQVISKPCSYYGLMVNERDDNTSNDVEINREGPIKIESVNFQ